MAFGSLMRRTLVGTLSTIAILAVSSTPARAQAPIADEPVRLTPTAWSAPALHISLSTSFAALQALDVATTLRAVHTGTGVEANPLVGGLANHPAALIGLKAGLTAATIASVRGLSRTHPKAAVLTMIGLNVGSAFVVRSNLGVAAR
jgi:hypothetical protein